MTNIELYINDNLCDIQNPENLGVRLNRVLINPAELATKDAQYSYSITLPATTVNDAIFSYANVEEVKNKFNYNHTAQLYVDGVKIFDGRFKLSEIDSDGSYKGNLVVPAPKTVKDVFGETKMNELAKWEIDFNDFSETVSKINADAAHTPQNCIFPLVLYGLLPKQLDENDPSPKERWDDKVQLNMLNFPPSVNCAKLIRHMFESKDLKISGSFFDDPNFRDLYVSYQNPVEYPQEWNWGRLGKMRIKGKWSNLEDWGASAENIIIDGKTIEYPIKEPYVYESDTDGKCYTTNLLLSSRTEIDETEFTDTGGNVTHYVGHDSKNLRKNVTYVRIPFSGLYKIQFAADIELDNAENRRNEDNGTQVISGRSSQTSNHFDRRRYEVKVLRDNGEGEFSLDSSRIDGKFYKDNFKQTSVEYPKIPENYPKYLPQMDDEAVLFVDPMTNDKLVCGFHWGKHDGIDESVNTQDSSGRWCEILSTKNGWSWDVKFSQKNKVFSAINSKPYHRFDLIDDNKPDEDSDKDIPDGDEAVLGWYHKQMPPITTSKKYGIDLKTDGATQPPLKNHIQRGKDDGADTYTRGSGSLSQITWFKKGEYITVVSTSDEGRYRRTGKHSRHGWTRHKINFDLKIEAFRTDVEWIKVDNEGTGTAEMDWNDASNFRFNNIDLVKFLPSEMKADEWIENFCKAFNLKLTHDGGNRFKLDVKQRNKQADTIALDLDNKATVLQTTKQPLGLPAVYELGFTIKEEEKGYADTKYTGGGCFETGSIDGSKLEQKSKFSYNWFKKIDKKTKDLPVEQIVDLPIITNEEIWKDVKPDKEIMSKLYTNYAQRFWYYKGLLNDKAGEITVNKKPVLIADVSNINKQGLTLSYENKPNTILRNYFSLIATNDSNYTELECYLTPDEYELLNGSCLVKFNGDVYYVAAIDGYDPTGRSKTKLKLIRRIS